MQLKTLIKQYKPAVIKKHAELLLPSQWNAMQAIERCRTAKSGERYVQCKQCATHIGHRSRVETAIAPPVKTMKSINGWIGKSKSYCPLNASW